MARIDSKTNWVPTDRPVPVDFNRIENNNEQAFNEIDQEKVDRAAAVTAEANARIAADNNLQNNITAEANARIAADNNLQSQINNEKLFFNITAGSNVLASYGNVFFGTSTTLLLTHRIVAAAGSFRLSYTVFGDAVPKTVTVFINGILSDTFTTSGNNIIRVFNSSPITPNTGGILIQVFGIRTGGVVGSIADAVISIAQTKKYSTIQEVLFSTNN